MLFAGLLAAVLPGVAHAHAVFGEVMSLKQPDGTRVDVRIWGDEFFQHVESLDGYTLIRDPRTQEICYARLSLDERRLVSTGVRVYSRSPEELRLKKHLRVREDVRHAFIRSARERFAREGATHTHALLTSSNPPATGNVQTLCLIIDFADEPGIIAPSEVDDYCNQVGYSGFGNNGSVRDYYYDISNGQLTYTNFVPDAYYRAAQPKSYYTNPSITFGFRARDLIIEALEDLEASGFDFSQYDSNGDGKIDGVNAFYAGDIDNGWSEGLWPHSWTVSYSADGVSTLKYQITNMGSALKLGTFCHETGHMLCFWPDLYDYGFDSEGVGKFCLMSHGGSGTNPTQPSAPLKHAVGWTTPTLLITPADGLLLPSVGNVVYKFDHPFNPFEYFMIENRQKTGRDSGLPDHGVAIWHVDENGNNDFQQMTPFNHYQVSLLQADGENDLEYNQNTGDATDLFAAPDFVECTPVTNPDTHWWSGDASELGIRNISTSAATMTFDFGLSNIELNPAAIENATYLGGTIGDETFTVSNSYPTELEYSISEDGSFFSVSPTAGVTTGENDPITIDYDDAMIAALPKGFYQGTITIASEGALNDPQVVVVTLIVETVRPDFDGDEDVDMLDFAHFQRCITGEGNPQTDLDCLDARLDADDDVDADDFAYFDACRSGPAIIADPACDDGPPQPED